MTCNKCNNKLPNDSEFCQYCGSKIEKISAETDMKHESKIDDISTDEALSSILKMQAQNTVAAMKLNSQSQPNNEDDADFGLVPEKPIFTLALMSVDGEKEYLNRLYTISGEKIRYNRRGSMSVECINGMIDIYDTYLPSGQPYKTIYINMYGAKVSTKAPEGFKFNNSSAQAKPVKKKEKVAKNKYCSRCGSIINNKTKVCTGCGKQYFRGFRFTKFSASIIALTLIISGACTMCVFHFINTQELNDKINDLRREVSDKQATIDRLESEKWENWSKISFYDTYAALVNEDSDEYHTYGCYYFDDSYFWIYNIDAAEDKGYYPCPYCHE